MENKQTDLVRVLAIAPTPEGLGYAVLDGETLVNWGVTTVTGDMNAKCLERVESYITLYQPDVLVLEDFNKTRRGRRIRLLIQDLTDLAQKHNVGVKLVTRAEIYLEFFADGKRNKDDLAEALAKRFPEELEPELPPKRREWTSEHRRMVMFDAVAMGLMARF